MICYLNKYFEREILVIPLDKDGCWIFGINLQFAYFMKLWAARPSWIVRQGYNQAGTFSSVLNFSLPAYGAQLGFCHTFLLLMGVTN